MTPGPVGTASGLLCIFSTQPVGRAQCMGLTHQAVMNGDLVSKVTTAEHVGSAERPVAHWHWTSGLRLHCISKLGQSTFSSSHPPTKTSHDSFRHLILYAIDIQGAWEQDSTLLAYFNDINHYSVQSLATYLIEAICSILF